MNTDTPRTDEAAVDVWRKSNGERMATSSDKVDANFARKLERELATVTAQRDKLVAVLQRIRDGYGGQVASPNCCEDCDYLLPIDEALQSLTPKP
jgi:hypothetical protein